MTISILHAAAVTRFGAKPRLASAIVFVIAFVFVFVLAVQPVLAQIPAAAPAAITPTPTPALPLSATAERIFDNAKNKLIQVRTLARASRSQASIGSGFLVGPALAITNYHVVSSKLVDPDLYDLEWLSPDQRKGGLRVMAVDVANDLALVKLDQAAADAPVFDVTSSEPRTGQRVFALGRPLDLGFHIIEGTHNGIVDGDINQHFLFSGAINPGMSGGPAVNAEGKVFAVNVAKNLNGDLVSYLVPGKHALALVERSAALIAPPSAADLLAEIARQTAERQHEFHSRLFAKPPVRRQLGAFKVMADVPPLVKCWGRADQATRTRSFRMDQVQCSSDSNLFLSDSFSTGNVNYQHTLVSSRELGRLRFAALVSQQSAIPQSGRASRDVGPRRCTERVIEVGAHEWRTVMCLAALRRFTGLYDFQLTATSIDPLATDNIRQALISRLSIDGIGFDDAQAIGRHYLEALQ